MKRFFVFIASICILISLFSCEKKFDLLEYQSADICAKCLVNDTYIINVEKSQGLRSLSIIEPVELDTISFKLENDTAIAICDGTEIPIDISNLGGIVALCSIFDLDSEAISSSSVDESGTTVSFLIEGVSYSVSYGKNNLPTHFNISSDNFSLAVKVLELKVK